MLIKETDSIRAEVAEILVCADLSHMSGVKSTEDALQRLGDLNLVLRTDPKNPKLLRTRAKVKNIVRDYRGAIKDIALVKKYGRPTTWDLYEIGAARIGLGQQRRAKRIAKRILNGTKIVIRLWQNNIPMECPSEYGFRVSWLAILGNPKDPSGYCQRGFYALQMDLLT